MKNDTCTNDYCRFYNVNLEFNCNYSQRGYTEWCMKDGYNLIQKLTALKNFYPGLEIVIMVDSDICEDEYSCYAGKISKVETGLYCEYDDCICSDEEEVKEKISYNISVDNESLSEIELNALVDKEYEKLKKKDVIYLHVDLP